MNFSAKAVTSGRMIDKADVDLWTATKLKRHQNVFNVKWRSGNFQMLEIKTKPRVTEGPKSEAEWPEKVPDRDQIAGPRLRF